MEDDEEEFNIKGSVKQKRFNKTQSTHILFLWASPLYSIKDDEESPPYEIVELPGIILETDNECWTVTCADRNRQNDCTSHSQELNIINDLTEQPQHNHDFHSSQSTFAKFGYENLSDLDSYSEEDIAMETLGHMVSVPGCNEQTLQYERGAWPIGKMKGIHEHLSLNKMRDDREGECNDQQTNRVSFGEEIEDCYQRKENESEETIINTGKHLILNDHSQQTTFSGKLSSPREDMSEQQTTKTIATTLTGNETNSFENGLESVDFNEVDDNNTTTLSFSNNENSICISKPSENPKVNMASTPDFQTCNDPQPKQDDIERRKDESILNADVTGCYQESTDISKSNNPGGICSKSSTLKESSSKEHKYDDSSQTVPVLSAKKTSSICDKNMYSEDISTGLETSKSTHELNTSHENKLHGKEDLPVVRKPKSYFYNNIKSKNQVVMERPSRGNKTTAPQVKKEYDNSLQLLKDLCLIGSTKSNNRLTREDNIPANSHINLKEQCKHDEIDDDTGFIIRHFGTKDDSTNANHLYGKSIQNLNSFREKRGHHSRKENDIEHMYKSECSKIEKSRYKEGNKETRKAGSVEYVSTSRRGNHSHQNGCSTGTPFEVQANQPWSPNHSTFSDDNNEIWSSEHNNPFWSESKQPFFETSNKSNSQNHAHSKSLDSNQPHNIQWNPEHGRSFDSNDQHSSHHIQSMSSDYKHHLSRENSQSPSPLENKPFTRASRGRERSSGYTCHSEDCPSCSITRHLSELTELIDKQGLELKNVAGDGNCLFAAVVDQLRINGDFSYNTKSLRAKSVQYLRKTPIVEDGTHLEGFLTNESWEDYLERMEWDGEWGDDIILRGISELTGRKIVVYSSYMSKTILTPTHVYEKEELYIGHIRRLMHFVSLRPRFWDVMWPGRTICRRMREIMDEFQLSMTTKVSSIEAVEEKFMVASEALTKGDVVETDRVLAELRESIEQNKTLPFTDKLSRTWDLPETMEQLIGDTFKIDEISGITMLHLSFLVKTLIKPQYFFEKNEDLKSVFDNNKDNCIRIGSAALGLHADLYDFTDIMPQSSFSISEKRAMTKYLSLTIVVIFPRQKYCIRDSILENVSGKDVLIIDDSATYPGYIRLRPTNTAYWSGCVEWLSCQEGFLRHLKVNRINDEIIKPFDCLSVEQFQGLEYGVWPRQAYNWTKREPQSGWPSKETIREASEKGCLIIRRAHEFSEHPDIEWQFVFNEAEKVLVQSFTHAMMYCFRVFKTLVDHHQTRNLKVKPKTYWQLTAMFYSSERIPHQVWSSNPGGCIMFLISWLYNHIHQKNLPHYFIPENNMIEHVDDEEMKLLETSLQVIRLSPFPSIYFLLESHSFLNLSVIDQIESSIEDYKLLEDKHKVVEMIFVPISFTLARRSVKCKVNQFYIQALEYIENAFELTINVKKEDDHTSFVDFILRFLSSVKDGDVKLPFAQLVDKEKKTNLSQLMLKHTASQTISNILSPEYTGVWGHVYIDATENKWDSLFDILDGIFVGNEFEECAELLRCSILVLQRELNACQVDYSTITDDNVRKQLQNSNMKEVSGNLTYLVCFYKYLSMCYDMMNQIELFQEHIHDYEEIVSRIQSPGQYQNLAKIYRQLGNREKAVELEEKVKSLMSSGGHGRVLMLLA